MSFVAGVSFRILAKFYDMDNTVIEELESFIFLGSQKHNASFEDDDLIAPVPLIHAAQFLADDCPNKSLP